MIVDNATPIAQGHLPNNTRITALKSPVVDDECGISCSIRLLHSNKIDREKLIDSGFATAEMFVITSYSIHYTKLYEVLLRLPLLPVPFA